MVVSNRDLHLLQNKTMETWRNTSNPDFPFQRQEGTYQQRGCLGLNSPAAIDNDVYFLGGDRVVYRMVGYQTARISHHAIETFLRKQSLTDLQNAVGFSITYEGHYWYILSVANGTFAFDVTTSRAMQSHQWFQLKSVDQDNWRVTSSIDVYGKILMGDSLGYITELDAETFNELGNTQLKQRTTGYYHQERNPITPSRIKLAFNQGVGNSSVTNPEVSMSISRDFGHTFGAMRNRPMGEAGQYETEATWSRNGISKSVALRFTVTDDVDFGIDAAYAEFSEANG